MDPPAEQDGCVIEGSTSGWLTVSVDEAVSPPPGVGLSTVMALIPPDEISAASMVAEISVELTKLVALDEPSILTTDDELKFDPCTVSVKSDPPAQMNTGSMLVSVGTGLEISNPLLVPSDNPEVLALRV